MNTKFYMISIIAIFLFVGCQSTTNVAPLPVTENEEGITVIEPQEAAIEEEPQIVEEAEAVTALANSENEENSEEVVIAEPLPVDSADSSSIATDELIVDWVDPILNAELLLDVALPTEPADAAVWSQPALYTDLANAQQTLRRFGFSGPLYQEYLDPDYRDQFEQIAEGVWRIPFYAFRGEERLTISAGGIFYENLNVIDDYPTTISEAEIRPLAEAQITTWGELDFEYTLVNDGPGNIAVKRLINGNPVDYVEAYFHYNNSGELVYASYNILEQLDAQAAAPILTAEQAWQLLQQKEIDYDKVNYHFLYNNNLPIPTEPGQYDESYLSWIRTYQSGEAAEVYGYPLLFMPVQDDSLPYLQVGDYNIIAAPEDLFTIVSTDISQIKITGTVGEDGRDFTMSTWEAINDIYPLSFSGIVTRDGNNGLLTTDEGTNYFIPDLPETFPATLDVYVYAWERDQGDAPYPILDWLNLDQRIERDVEEYPSFGVSPDEPEVAIESIAIHDIQLGYTYLPQWGNEDVVEQPDYDVPPTDLIPTWQFYGTTDSGEEIIFNVRAKLE